MRRILNTILALFLFALVSNAQIQERYVKAIETLETGVSFVYQGIDIPVLDITYHEFSADSLTWRKNFVEGDCYVRFSNEVDNSTDQHPADSWWVFNFCTCNGAITSGSGTSQIDTILITINGVTDTITGGIASIEIPSPITVTGSTTNEQTDSTHTHELILRLGELEDVDTTGVADTKILKFNGTEWVIATDLVGGGASGSLTVGEQDGTPTVTNVNTILVENGTVTNNGAGSVSIDFFQEAANEAQDFYRAGEFSASVGDNFVTFTSSFSDNDYILVADYALYSDGSRQELVYDSLAVDGFRVLDVVGTSTIHYLAIRDLDSLGLAAENQGKVLASGTDATMSYLNGAVDNNTISVVGDELAFIADSLDLDYLSSNVLVVNGDTIRATSQLDVNDTIMATKNYVLSVAGAGNGWDSLVFQPSNGYLVWWYAGSRIDSTSIDDRYVKIADSTEYVTPHALLDTINNTDGLKTMVYSISLPAAANLTARIAGAVVYPVGTSWTLTANSGVNLDIEHNLGRRVASVSVFSVTGTQEQQLFNTAALNGVITSDSNNLRIQSLATSFAAKDLRIYIVFE